MSIELDPAFGANTNQTTGKRINMSKLKLRREINRMGCALDHINDELNNEIERGNALCKIIYKLVHGYDTEGMPLEMHEIARIAQIIKNIDRRI